MLHVLGNCTVSCTYFIFIFFSPETETWRHQWNDFWWSLCYYDDGIILNLHRIDIQWIFFGPIWTVRALCLWMSWSFLQVGTCLYDWSIWREPKIFLFSLSVLLTFISLLCRDASTAGLVKVRATYPFGVDPKWHGTRSELPFLNSLKMKMSILLGVAQMNLGIILSYFNAKFSGNGLNIRWVTTVEFVEYLAKCLS